MLIYDQDHSFYFSATRIHLSGTVQTIEPELAPPTTMAGGTMGEFDRAQINTKIFLVDEAVFCVRLLKRLVQNPDENPL